jgi:hypothetical protein
MNDRLPHSDQQKDVAYRGKKKLFERFRDPTGRESLPEGRRQLSRPRSPFHPSRRGKSPNPKNEKAGNAQFTAGTNAETPEIKLDDNEAAQPDTTRELFSEDANPDMKTDPTDSNGDNDMWKIAEDQLRNDPKMKEILDAYYGILKWKSDVNLEPAGTPERKKQICNFIDSEHKKLPDSSALGKCSSVFKKASENVVKAKDVIAAATAPCLPASIACAGVMLILTVSWSLQLRMAAAYINLLCSFFFKPEASERFSSKA